MMLGNALLARLAFAAASCAELLLFGAIVIQLLLLVRCLVDCRDRGLSCEPSDRGDVTQRW
jgi:hypothetical protein